MTAEPGPLLARGRSADVFDLGGGRVLRRRRSGPIPEHEVVAMRLALEHGYPVPRIHEVDGTDMVLDRLDGRSMLDELAARPWRVHRLARQLAELHLRLRRIAPSDELRGDLPRDALVHGDLHPGNVVMTADGPVVIDWEGASAGADDEDVATLWLLASAAEVDDVPAPVRPIVGLVRRRMTSTVLAATGRPSRATVDRVCAVRLGDPNMRESERARIRAFGAEHGTGPSAYV